VAQGVGPKCKPLYKNKTKQNTRACLASVRPKFKPQYHQKNKKGIRKKAEEQDCERKRTEKMTWDRSSYAVRK
jgi:hypothetical protein